MFFQKSTCVLVGIILIAANASAQPFTFVDISAQVDTLTQIDKSVSGLAWGDFNNDGYQDLHLATFDVNNLMRNNGDGTFTDVSVATGLNDSTSSKAATWGDIDNDGWLDIYISENKQQPNKLFHNNGDGTFSDVSMTANIEDPFFAQGGAWGDYDEDGDVDFFLLNDDAPNRLYRNDGALTFMEVAGDLGLDNEFAAYGITWLDFDDDNNLDLFVTNCRNLFGSTWINFLYRNDGDATFTDVSAEMGVDYFGESWGTNAIDFDNDLDMDLLVVNSDPEETFLLYENRDSIYVNVAAEAGLDGVGVAFSVTSGDYDNDGDIDFLVAGIDDANRLYRNDGDGGFTDISDQVEFPEFNLTVYNSIATADLDNDGWLEFAMADELTRPYVYHNQPPDSIAGNHWLEVKLIGVENNRFGIGSKIVAYTQDLNQVRHVIAGSGTYSEDMIPVHFGFGERVVIDSLAVRWPNGIIDRLQNVATDQILVIEEGSTITAVESTGRPRVRTFRLHQNYPNPFNPTTAIAFTLDAPGDVSLTIYNVLGQAVRTFGLGTRPAGTFEVTWDARDDRGIAVPSGLYFSELSVGGNKLVGKMVLSR